MEAKTMTSSGCAVAWRGRLADKTDKGLLSTSTTMGDKDLMDMDASSREEVPSTKHDFHNTFTPHDTWLRLPEHFWMRHPRHRQLLCITEASGRLSIKFPPEEEGFIADPLISPSLWLTLFPSSESEPTELDEGGVYSPPHKRKVLFSFEMEFRTADLPRLKPSMIVDPLIFFEDDDA
jgi:hypothetical protein